MKPLLTCAILACVLMIGSAEAEEREPPGPSPPLINHTRIWGCAEAADLKETATTAVTQVNTNFSTVIERGGCTPVAVQLGSWEVVSIKRVNGDIVELWHTHVGSDMRDFFVWFRHKDMCTAYGKNFCGTPFGF